MRTYRYELRGPSTSALEGSVAPGTVSVPVAPGITIDQSVPSQSTAEGDEQVKTWLDWAMAGTPGSPLSWYFVADVTPA